MKTHTGSHDARDSGTVLPIVLVIVIALGGVVAAVAGYSSASLSYGSVVRDRTDRLAAADAGMRFAIDQIKLKSRSCVWDNSSHDLPGLATDFNGAEASVACRRLSSGIEDIDLFAAIMTGDGVPANGSDSYLLASQGGSQVKTLGGPVFMERIDNNAFNFSSASTHSGVEIEEGPLLYPDPTPNCVSEHPSAVSARASGKLTFTPELVYGPACINQGWQDKFPSMAIERDLTTLQEKDGTLAIGVPVPLVHVDVTLLATWLLTLGPLSYVDVYDALAPLSPATLLSDPHCRVFVPGRYTTMPDVDGYDAYFMSGDYVFDPPTAGPTSFRVRQGTVTMGKRNAFVGSINELDADMTNACKHIQTIDPATQGDGATVYLAGPSHIEVLTGGSLEIHARRQGNRFVSVQQLCNLTLPWCEADEGGVDLDGDGVISFGGRGGFAGAVGTQSTLNATSTPDVVYTASGNQKEFVSHGWLYAPTASMEFGNVSSTATQKLLGGLAVAQLYLQSATSATNFEISVPVTPVTGRILVTSTASKNGGSTTIRAVLQWRPYEPLASDRVAVNSWRVCDDTC